ncbi:MAG: hypothetical protein ACI8Q1_002224 [Parvicella sp.]|jgi:hypothetical protein
MKSIVIFLTSLILQITAYANVVTSVIDGTWNTAATWDNGVPLCGDTIYIFHLVTVNSTVDYGTCTDPMFIELSGTLDFPVNGQRLHLSAGSGIGIQPGGLLTGSGSGGGKSTFLTIGGTAVWQKSDGPIPGPSSFGSPLPIELIEFNAIFAENKVNIYWSTAAELNNEYFVVLRSRDGFEWEEIATVAGAGNTSNISEYFEQDLKPLNGVSYYKLKQVDFNGQSEEFNVVPVENTSKSKVAFKIFPNPTTQENINMSLEGFKDQEILVVVRDIQGREFFSKIQIVDTNSETTVLPVESDLLPGVYLIVASSKDAFYSQKVIVK